MNEQLVLPRSLVKDFLDEVTRQPEWIISARVARRDDLALRYPPKDQYKNGDICHVGDHSTIRDRKFHRGTGPKLLIEKSGTWRWITVKNRTPEQWKERKELKHHISKGGTLPFDPIEKGLYLLVGMYNDSEKIQPNGMKMSGRYGQLRPFCLLDMRSVSHIRYAHREYVVPDPVITACPSKGVLAFSC